MVETSARLSIDVWHTTVAAVVRTPDGRVVPLTVDHTQALPFGVAVTDDGSLRPGVQGQVIGHDRPECYVPMPGHRLLEDRIQVGGMTVDPVDLVAAPLAQVAEQARAVAGGVPVDVVLCPPSGWVSRQWMKAAVAASRAGLAAPRKLVSAEAIVRDQMATGTAVPVDAVVLVCRLDATVGEVVLLHRRVDGFEQGAALTLGELGEIPGATLTDQASYAIREALTANQVPGGQVAAVFCHVGADVFPALSAAIAAAGVTVAPVRVGELAGAVGGLQSTVPTRPVKVGGRLARLVQAAGGAAACWFAAAVAGYQLFAVTEVYEATTISPTKMVTLWCGWGLVPLFALLGLACATVAVADLRALRASSPPPGRPDPKLGSGLVFAAMVGAGLAVVVGLVGGAEFGFDPVPLLTWTLGATLPTAAVFAVAGLLAARRPVDGGWPDRLRFPVEAAVVAAVATVAVFGAYSGIPFRDSIAWWWMEHVGAVGIGFAIALLVTRDLLRWFGLGLVIGGPATFTISLTTVDTIGSFLIGAITLWWLVRLARIVWPMLRVLLAATGTLTPPPPPQAGPDGASTPGAGASPTG